jgi:hypothetical protein
MPSYDALDLLRRSDPAVRLEPLSAQERELLRDRIVVLPARSRPRAARPRRLLTLAAAAAAVAVLGVGVAWAAGTWSPLALFQSNPQRDHGGAVGSLWDQQVVPGSVVDAATVDLPDVGAVGFWYADTAQHGWCAALRLPSGAWVGTGDDRLDAGGTVPGCFPTREQVNGAGPPVYVIDGFDYQEGDVDARPAGGAFWRIRYGRITVRHAARVADLVSGRSTHVAHGDLFVLAIPDAHPMGPDPLHLVAYDANGKVVADDAPPS